MSRDRGLVPKGTQNLTFSRPQGRRNGLKGPGVYSLIDLGEPPGEEQAGSWVHLGDRDTRQLLVESRSATSTGLAFWDPPSRLLHLGPGPCQHQDWDTSIPETSLAETQPNPHPEQACYVAPLNHSHL